MRGEEAAADELLLDELLLVTGWGCSTPGEGDEQETLKLQDNLALIPLVSSSNLTLIERG